MPCWKISLHLPLFPTGPLGPVHFQPWRLATPQAGDAMGPDVGVRLQPVRQDIPLRPRAGDTAGRAERTSVPAVPREQGETNVHAARFERACCYGKGALNYCFVQ